MKEITKMSRLSGSLEKLFNMINADWFGGELETPIITVQSTPKAYGHVTVSGTAWTVKGEGRRELNIGAGTLYRDIDQTVSTMMHEACHIYDIQHGIKDTSNSGTYHNRKFRETAEVHGLNVTKSERYGHAHTAANDELLRWILENDIPEIQLTRNDGGRIAVGGPGSHNPGEEGPLSKKKSNSRRYICPCCFTKVRATREVNLICADCIQPLVQG